MKKPIYLIIIALFVVSCGKRHPVTPVDDGSINNHKPDGGKYIEFNLVKHPNLSKVKVGDTVDLYFKTKLEYKENFEPLFYYSQIADAGSQSDHNVLGNITYDSTSTSVPLFSNVSVYDVFQKEEKSYVLYKDSATVLPTGEEGIYKITYEPKYSVPTTLNFYVYIKSMNSDNNIMEHKSNEISLFIFPKHVFKN